MSLTLSKPFGAAPARAAGLAELLLLVVVLCACKQSSQSRETPRSTAATPATPAQPAQPVPPVAVPDPPTPEPPVAPGARVPASAGVTVSVSTRYYDISGDTGQELRRDLNLKSPADLRGVKHDANTNYYVRWSYPFDRRRGSCGLGKVSVSVDVKYELPRWRPTSEAPADLVTKWKRYESALVEHEYKHRDFGVRAGNEIQRTLSTFKPRGTCPSSDKDANAAANLVLERHLKEEREFDRRTRHGATEGAQFF